MQAPFGFVMTSVEFCYTGTTVVPVCLLFIHSSMKLLTSSLQTKNNFMSFFFMYLKWTDLTSAHVFAPNTPSLKHALVFFRTWSTLSQRNWKEPGNVSLLLTRHSLLWSCNSKPWVDPSHSMPARNLLAFCSQAREKKTSILVLCVAFSTLIFKVSEQFPSPHSGLLT